LGHLLIAFLNELLTKYSGNWRACKEDSTNTEELNEESLSNVESIGRNI